MTFLLTRMSRRSLSCCAALGAAVLLVAPRAGANLTLTGELDTATTEYSYGSNINLSSVRLDASITPLLNFDFSTAGHTLLTVTWAAPAGKKIVIAPPTGWGDAELAIQLSGGSRFASGLEVHGIRDVMSFTDLTGSFDGVLSTDLSFAPINYFQVTTHLPGVASGTEITFTSLSFAYLLPGELDMNFSSVPAIEMSIYGNIQFAGEAVGNPGQWLSLQDVGGPAIPEPSTYALIFGSAALGFVVWRRRRRIAS